MAHNENCRKCKNVFIKALTKEFGEVTEQWKSGWPCRIDDVLHLPEISKSKARSIKEIYSKLQQHRGYQNFVGVSKLPRCDYYIKPLNCLIEIDESQHFTAPRALTLSSYPRGIKLGYDKKIWLRRCKELDRHDNDPVDRDEKRAWYDTLRDLLPAYFGMNPTIRVWAKEMVWCEESTDSIRGVLRQKYFKNRTIKSPEVSMKRSYKKTILANHKDYVGKKLLLVNQEKTGLFRCDNPEEYIIEVRVDSKGHLSVYKVDNNFKRKEENISLRALGQNYLELKDPSVPQMLQFLVTPEMEVERIFNCIRYKYLDSLRHGVKAPGDYITAECNELFKALGRFPFRGIKKEDLRKKHRQILRKHGFPTGQMMDLQKEQKEIKFIIQYMRDICFNSGAKRENKVALYKELIAIKPGAHEIFMDLNNDSEHWDSQESGPISKFNVLKMLHNVSKKKIEIDISKVNSDIKYPSYLTYSTCYITEGPFIFRKSIKNNYFNDLRTIKRGSDPIGFKSKFNYLDYFGMKANLTDEKKLDDFLKSAARFKQYLN